VLASSVEKAELGDSIHRRHFSNYFFDIQSLNFEFIVLLVHSFDLSVDQGGDEAVAKDELNGRQAETFLTFRSDRTQSQGLFLDKHPVMIFAWPAEVLRNFHRERLPKVENIVEHFTALKELFRSQDWRRLG